MNAVVVGGGYAGIRAALALADAGRDVTLLEARRHWGGRATSWPDPKMGDEVDNGPHVWLGCYEATLVLLARLGTKDRVPFPPGLDLAFREPGGRVHRLRAPGALGRAGLGLALLGYGALGVRDRAALGRALAAAPAPIPEDTAATWLDRLGQSQAVRRAFWAPLTEAAVNLPLERAAASLLDAVVMRAFRGPARNAAVGVPRGGLAGLVAPVADALAARGGRARLGAAVRAVRREGAAFRVALEDGAELAADAVVLAVPADAAQGLLAAIPEAASRLADAARVPAAPIVSVTLWFEPAVALEPIVGLLAGENHGFHWAFDRGLAAPPRGPRPIVLIASAADALDALPSAEIVRRARAALAAYGITTREPAFARVIKEPHATPALTPEAERARPTADSGVPGLAFAGDWTATGLPATIEGAVVSGLAAASAILRLPTAMEAPG